MPPRNATGMNTAHSTSTIATTAPDTSRIASIAASNGGMLSSRIRRSTFSSTTIASSTTMPIASTMREQGQRVDREADQPQPGERADQRHRHRDHRDQGRAPGLQEQEHHREHQQRRLEDGGVHFLDRGVDEARGVERDGVVDALGEGGLQLAHPGFAPASATSSALAPGCRNVAMPMVGLAVERVRGVVVERAELDARDVLEPQHAAGPAARAPRSRRTPRARPGARCAVTV